MHHWNNMWTTNEMAVPDFFQHAAARWGDSVSRFERWIHMWIALRYFHSELSHIVFLSKYGFFLLNHKHSTLLCKSIFVVFPTLFSRYFPCLPQLGAFRNWKDKLHPHAYSQETNERILSTFRETGGLQHSKERELGSTKEDKGSQRQVSPAWQEASS